MKDDLIKEIVLIEWEMFKNVSNSGGTAPCQEDPKTFLIMRTSQALSWTVPMLDSYLEDLRNARQQGRNLMTEKYARMMRDTFPEEYRLLENQLPPLDEEVQELAERITAIMVKWAKEAQAKYPHVVGAGRPIESSGSRGTSLETYIRGELLTYSSRTLSLSWGHYSKCLADGLNQYEAVLDSMVRSYGYGSIAEAERKTGSTPA